MLPQRHNIQKYWTMINQSGPRIFSRGIISFNDNCLNDLQCRIGRCVLLDDGMVSRSKVHKNQINE